MCLGGAFCWTGIVMLVKTTRLGRSVPTTQLLYQLLVSAALLLAISPLFGAPIRSLSNEIIFIFLALTLAVVVFGFLAWFWLLSIYPTAEVTSFSFLTPIFGVLFGWLLLGEEIGVGVIVSLALVCLGVYLVSKPTNAREIQRSVSLETKL